MQTAEIAELRAEIARLKKHREKWSGVDMPLDPVGVMRGFLGTAMGGDGS